MPADGMPIVGFTPGAPGLHGAIAMTQFPVDVGTPTNRAMNSYSGLLPIRYRAMSSGATLIRMHRFLRLAAVDLPEEYRRFLSHFKLTKDVQTS